MNKKSEKHGFTKITAIKKLEKELHF